ncbi:MAG: PAS domain S-box protein, partial [Longimicrobiales bacterium]|nr:PAS domain S-box protein [Longimicrobiales bacterium]
MASSESQDPPTPPAQSRDGGDPWLGTTQDFHKALLDAVGEAVIVTDLQGTVQYWNRAAADLYGWSAEEALGMDIVDLTPSDASRQEALAIMESLAAGNTWRGEFQVRRKDGSTFPALVSNSPVLNSAGELAGIIGVSSDLTSLKETEDALRERNKELQTLKQAGEILNREDQSIDARLEEVVRLLPDGWLNPADTEARLAYDHLAVETPGFKETEWMLSATFSTREGKGRLDVVRLDPSTTDGPVFLDEEQELLENLARMVRQAVDRASLRRLLSEAFAALQEAVFLVDAQRRIRFVNEAAEKIFGYGREELVGRFTEILHESEESFHRFAEIAGAALGESGTFTDDFRLRRSDGSVFEAEQTVALLNPQRGLEGGLVSVIRDMSQQRAAERELQESEERFRQIAEHIEDVFWVTDREKRRLEYVSPAYEEVWGRSAEELREDPEAWLRAVVPEDRERVRAGVERQRHGPHTQEYRIRRPDGSERQIVDRSFTVYDDKGDLNRIIGVARDVTDERLLAERFGRLSEEITDVIYVLSPEGKVIASSPSVEAAIGYTREEFEGMDAVELVHPEDRDTIREGLERVAHEPGKVTRAEYRVVTKDGNILHVET